MINKRKRVLQILIGGPTFTGVSSYLYQQYRFIDRQKVIYDFLFCVENSMELVMTDQIFSESRFYTLNARWRNTRSMDYLKISRELKRILCSEQYDAVVVNTSVVAVVATCMHIVKQHPNVKLIAHAHNTDIVIRDYSVRHRILGIVRIIENLFRASIRKNAYAMFACSKDAGRVTFGEKAVNMDKFMIIHNAIELPIFHFDPAVREAVRRGTDTSDSTLVCGNVGKLSKGKNQSFLIQVFSLIHQKKPDSQLWLIGEGKEKERLVAMTREMGIEKAVFFLGQKSNVNCYLQGMDVFAFTTLSEGLGIVAIEAQAAGLPTLVSDGVPDEVLLTPLAKKEPLNSGCEVWANKIIDLYDSFPCHKDYSDDLRKAGYDIRVETKRITEYYYNLSS